jgi:hypothetical protein
MMRKERAKNIPVICMSELISVIKNACSIVDGIILVPDALKLYWLKKVNITS